MPDYRYLHHQRIASLLEKFDANLLEEAHCYFGGGTAIAMQLGEFRLSNDVDFLCGSQDGFRLLRCALEGSTLGEILKFPVEHLRDVRVDRYAIRTALNVQGAAIKVELLAADDTSLECESISGFPVPVLSRNDLYAQKLMAAADRGLSRAIKSRDIIDLSMMIHTWGDVPETAWDKAYKAYGENYLNRGVENAVHLLLSDPIYLKQCVHDLQMENDAFDLLVSVLTNFDVGTKQKSSLDNENFLG